MATTTPRRRHPSTVAAAAGGEWAAVSASSASEGTWRMEALGKQQLMRRTGLRVRDLRALLDPAQLSHPSSVMGRDRAVVFNLHRVHAVITASEVLVPSPRDPSVAPLVGELHARLASAAATATTSPPEEDGKALPFEFRALEVCLDLACKSLDHETSMLEKEAYPALDALTSKVTTLNLEHVRQLKSRLLAISGGVHKARDELEHLLDDDADMTAMHLSEKLAFFQAAAGQSSRFDIEDEPGEFDHQRDSEDDQAAEREEDDEGEGSVPFSPKIDELEKLLEAYFLQIDGTLNKLSTLREYVEDTEDYINLMLDDKQNQLLQMGVVLSTAALVLTAAIAATGVFAINIHFALYTTTNTSTFWVATAGMLGAAAALFVAAIVYYRKKGILR